VAGEIIVLITAASKEEAEKIGMALVNEHVAACVNIVTEVRSLFFWNGTTHDERETLLICKSKEQLLELLITKVKALHSYSVPEILALPIIGGSTDYLMWLQASTHL